MSRLYLSNPCAFVRYFRTRDCGRSRRPAFPAPSERRRDNEKHNPGEIEPREGARMSPRHCERSEAIHLSSRGKMDCFVASLLAMTAASCLTIESESRRATLHPPVMPGLVPGIHVFLAHQPKTWMAGTSPAMTQSPERSDD